MLFLAHLIVDTNQILTIEKGCRIYVHADAPLIINGTIQVNGEKDSTRPRIFSGRQA